jgi:hypothetical protein
MMAWELSSYTSDEKRIFFSFKGKFRITHSKYGKRLRNLLKEVMKLILESHET